MNKKWIFLIIIIAIIVISSALLYFNHSSNNNNNNNNNEVVRVGYLIGDHEAPFLVAQAKNQYAKNNITIESHQFNNGGDLMTAMASGSIDIGYVGITPALSSVNKNVPIKVVGAVQNEGSAIVVPSDSNISNISQLKGKIIATPGDSSIQHMLLKVALNQSNLSVDDVHINAMKVAFMSNSLRSHQLDAIVTYEPYATIATSVGYGKIIATSSDILPNHPCCVVVATDDFISNRADVLETMLSIHENSSNYINSHPKESAEIMPPDLIPDPDIESKSLENLVFLSRLNNTYKQSVRDFMNIEIEMGLLNGTIPDSKIFYK